MGTTVNKIRLKTLAAAMVVSFLLTALLGLGAEARELEGMQVTLRPAPKKAKKAVVEKKSKAKKTAKKSPSPQPLPAKNLPTPPVKAVESDMEGFDTPETNPKDLVAARPIAKMSTEKPKPWFSAPGGSLGYSISSDYAQDRTPRKYNHNWSLGGSFKIKDVSVSSGLDFSYYSLDNEVPKEDDNMTISDFSVGASYGLPLTERNKLGFNGGVTFPTTEQSRYEGHYAILSGGVSLSTRIYKKIYSISNSLSGNYVFHRYEYSPSTNEINSAASGSYKLTNTITPLKGLSLGLSFGAKITTYLDGSKTAGVSLNNSQSISYALKGWSAGVSYSAGNHAEQDQDRLWYIDYYRRILSFNVGYEF